MRKPGILHYGDTLPPATEFEDGDLFFLRTAGELYIRTGGAWALSASSSMITSVQNDGTGVELVSDTGTSNTAKVRSVNTTGNGITLAITASGQEVELNFDKVAAGWGAANGFASLDANTMPREVPEVDTIATLRTMSGIGAKAIYVRGYYSDGDGGGGRFYYDASDTTSTDNGGTIIVDADGKRWKREYSNIIRAAWFGALSDGTDRTSEFNNAVAVAKSTGASIEVAPGTLKISPTSTIDLSGVPSIIGNATIDVSGATAGTIFSVTGSRTLIASGLALSEGQSSFTVNTGLSIERGDTIVVTSVEALPNPARTYYFKGSRVVAETYDPGTGALVVYPGVDFSYTSAYVWLIRETQLVVGNGIAIIGLEGGTQTGIEVKYGKASIHGTLKHFGATGIRYITSSGVITGSIADTVYSGTGTSYGVSINDLSNVHINGATILAARHAVAAGGGTWDEGDSGGTAGNSAAYPSSYTINGGHYGTNGTLGQSYAIDAHGVVNSITINGALIDGGLSIAARDSLVTNSTIVFSQASVGGLYVGSEAASTSWGRLVFSNNVIRGLGSTPGKAALAITGQLNTIAILNNVIDTDYGGDTTTYSRPVYISGTINSIIYSGNRVNTANTPLYAYFVVNSRILVSGNESDGLYNLIKIVNNNALVRVYGNTASNSPTYGFFIRGDGYTGADVTITNNTVYGSSAAGIYAYALDRVVAVGNRCFDNASDTSLSTSTRAGIYIVAVNNAHLVGNNCSTTGTNQQYGISVNGSTVTTNLILIGNETTGNATSDYYTASVSIKARNGNRGTTTINDYVLASDGNLYQFDGTSWTLA